MAQNRSALVGDDASKRRCRWHPVQDVGRQFARFVREQLAPEVNRTRARRSKIVETEVRIDEQADMGHGNRIRTRQLALPLRRVHVAARTTSKP